MIIIIIVIIIFCTPYTQLGTQHGANEDYIIGKSREYTNKKIKNNQRYKSRAVLKTSSNIEGFYLL